jgi:hypothetical protein
MRARSLRQGAFLGLLCLLALAPSALGAEPAEFTGKVLETMNTDTYTYVRVGNGQQEAWAAAPLFTVAVGEQVAFSTGMPMKDFKSETLKRTFPVVYFTNEIRKAGAAGQAPMAPPAAKAPSAGMAPGASKAPGVPAPSATPMARIEPPAGGTAIAAIVARPAEFSGKRVTVRGKVVKFNANILGKNWLHLRDGSGAAGAAPGADDITVTSSAGAKLGDIVTVTGVVATNRDFGSGYSYAVMIEEATLAQP